MEEHWNAECLHVPHVYSRLFWDIMGTTQVKSIKTQVPQYSRGMGSKAPAWSHQWGSVGSQLLNALLESALNFACFFRWTLADSTYADVLHVKVTWMGLSNGQKFGQRGSIGADIYLIIADMLKQVVHLFSSITGQLAHRLEFLSLVVLLW